MPENNKIFISYSRKNREFAKDLYKRLSELGFDLWRDVHDIEAGADDWWQAIEEAIKGCHTLILCMSLPALKSPVVADEWMLARTEGKRIIPVVADDIWTHPEVESGEFVIPNWMTRQNWIDYRDGTPEAEAAWNNLIKTLNKDYDPKPFINMVPELPPRFVRRPELADRIIGKLVDDKRDAVAMTTALRGAGGYGKTTLAKAVARDVRVQGAFDDGILWMTLGEELLSYSAEKLRTTLIQKAIDLIYGLTGHNEIINTLEMCHTKLNEAVGKRHILLVIDDVWDKRHLEPFLLDSENSSCIITTRSEDTVNRDDIQREPVDKMAPIEAVELLGAGIDPEEVAKNQEALKTLAHDLREYPLLLALANTQIGNWMQDMDLSLAQAIEFAREMLEERGVLGFDDTDTDARHDAVANTLEISLRQLSDQERTQYLELAIFPEDTAIPLTTLALYWGMTRVQTLQYCQKLFRKTALVQSFEGQAVRIHDVFRLYLLKQHDAAALRKLHERLIEKYGDLTHLPDDYAWRNIAYHLKEADRLDTLRELLLTFNYLQNKLNATEVNALIADCDALPDEREVQLVKSALNMHLQRIVQNRSNLVPSLLKSLTGYQKSINGIQSLFDSVNVPALIPVTQTFEVAEGIQLSVIQEFNLIRDAALSDDQQFVLAQSMGVNVWDWRAGELIRTLDCKLTMVSGDYLLSDSDVWNWKTGILISKLPNSMHAINGEFTFSFSGVWEWRTGKLVRTLQSPGNARGATRMTIHNDYILSYGYRSDFINIWNWKTGEYLQTLYKDEMSIGDGETVKMHEDHVFAGTESGEVIIWNWKTGMQIRTLAGHSDTVWAIEIYDQYAICGSGSINAGFAYENLNIWNWQTGEHIRNLQGHSRAVNVVTVRQNYLMSASEDHTIRIWNWKYILNSIEMIDSKRTNLNTYQTHLVDTSNIDFNFPQTNNYSHSRSVNSLIVDGDYAFSGSHDKTISVWNWKTGEHVLTIKGHTDIITSLAISGDFLFSVSHDKNIYVWKWKSGEHNCTLSGHSDHVRMIAVSGNYLLSKAPREVYVWNWKTGKIQRKLEIFPYAVNEEHLIIRKDSSIEIWNWVTDQLYRNFDLPTIIFEQFEVPRVSVNQSSLMTDKYLVLDTEIWNWKTGKFVEKLRVSLYEQISISGFPQHSIEGQAMAIQGDIVIVVFDDSLTSIRSELHLWNWKTNKCLYIFPLELKINSIAITQNLSRIILGDQAGNVHFLRPNAALLKLMRGEES